MCGQPVTNPLNRYDESRLSRLVAQLAAQLPHQHAQVVGFVLLRRAPDFVQDVLKRAIRSTMPNALAT